MPRPQPLERALWTLALVMVASAGAIFLWKRDPGFRSAADRVLQSVSARSSAKSESCEGVVHPPSSGPVHLPTCRTEKSAADPGATPWMAANAHGPDLGALAALSPDRERRRWSWEDVNTVPIVSWDGDTRVVKPGATGRRYGVQGEVDLSRALAMERAFGYQLDRAVIRYRDDAELAAKRTSLDAVLALHGVRRQHSAEGDVLAPDYEWMIQSSLDDLRPIATSILTEARRRGARGLREEFGAFASFVQQMKYAECPDPGDSKHRFGLSTPLWAVATNTGDCDTRAVLLAALARSIGLCDVYLVRDADHQHMLAAAAVPTKAGDKVLRPEGRTLVLVETTDEWPIGHVARRTRNDRLQPLYLASAGLSVQQGAARQPRSQRQTSATPAPRAGSARKMPEPPTQARLPQ